jgi:hypothetical protein
MNDTSTSSATRIFASLVSGDRQEMDNAMAALVTLGDTIDKRILRNLIHDRLQSGPPTDAAGPVTAHLLTALVRISEDERETALRSGSSDRHDFSRHLVGEMGGAAFERLRARTAAIEQYAAAMDEAETRVRGLFETGIKQARIGYGLSASMDLVVFYLGVVLVSASAFIVLTSGNLLNLWAGAGVGAVGLLGILYPLLIGRGRRHIGDTAAEMVRMQVIFLAYIRQLHQIDEAYTYRLLEDKDLPADDVREFQQMVLAAMNHSLQQLPAPAAPARTLTRPFVAEPDLTTAPLRSEQKGGL